jgi:hypothetical protein
MRRNFTRFLYSLALIPALVHPQASGYSLRFYGNGVNDIDRVKIQIDDPASSTPGPPADVGAEDFTLEFWMKSLQSDNSAGAISCGENYFWINGHIVFDRDRYNQNRTYGVSIAGGVLVFGVLGADNIPRTICGTTRLLDEQWHHVAVQRRRSDGWMWLYVDGDLEAQADGPEGDISYPDNGVPGNFCGGPCLDSDPYLVIGAEKHDAGSGYPSFSGWLDEVRLSNTLRYTGSFTPLSKPFVSDNQTVALYHFDEGGGNAVIDASGASGGPSPGLRRYGGSPAGPDWSTDTPFDLQVEVGDDVTKAPIPARASLEQNYPNPFNAGTIIQYRVAESDHVVLQICSVYGAEIRALVNERKEPGTYVVKWDGKDNDGEAMASGIYFSRMKAGQSFHIQKMILLR